MKMTHEKIIQISHQVTAAIEALDEVEIYDEPNNIRVQIVKILTDLMQEEEKIDQLVKGRIAAQKRTIVEGGGEWEILYRKYYSEELRKLGIAPPAPPHY